MFFLSTFLLTQATIHIFNIYIYISTAAATCTSYISSNILVAYDQVFYEPLLLKITPIFHIFHTISHLVCGIMYTYYIQREYRHNTKTYLIIFHNTNILHPAGFHCNANSNLSKEQTTKLQSKTINNDIWSVYIQYTNFLCSGLFLVKNT